MTAGLSVISAEVFLRTGGHDDNPCATPEDARCCLVMLTGTLFMTSLECQLLSLRSVCQGRLVDG